MRIMTRMGHRARRVARGRRGLAFVAAGQLGRCSRWRLARRTCPGRKHDEYISHFRRPGKCRIRLWVRRKRAVGKKCLALRIASVMARDEGWLAEHMLILKITSPDGDARYMAGAFPSGCGKTSLAMLQPTIPGWKVETVGDDIAWLRFGADGRLYAIDPEAGFFGIAPGTGPATNANAIAALSGNSIFTNVALTAEGDVWWEGLTDSPPERLIDWIGRDWTPNSVAEPAAQPNPASPPLPLKARSSRRSGRPGGRPDLGDPVRRSPRDAVPLVTEAFDWEPGVFLGLERRLRGDRGRREIGGELRRDPFAMLPFCGYNMGDYFAHWLAVGAGADRPSCRGSSSSTGSARTGGKFVAGIGENSRVLKWIVGAAIRRGRGQARTPIRQRADAGSP